MNWAEIVLANVKFKIQPFPSGSFPHDVPHSSHGAWEGQDIPWVFRPPQERGEWSGGASGVWGLRSHSTLTTADRSKTFAYVFSLLILIYLFLA